MNDISRWDGKAWRNGQPLRHDKTTTVADVVAYETEELGNSLYIFGDALELYGHLPASKTIWVCPTRKASEQYRGEPEKIELHGVIVASDNYSGYLVLEGA
jgi:hypothetical protein